MTSLVYIWQMEQGLQNCSTHRLLRPRRASKHPTATRNQTKMQRTRRMTRRRLCLWSMLLYSLMKRWMIYLMISRTKIKLKLNRSHISIFFFSIYSFTKCLHHQRQVPIPNVMEKRNLVLQQEHQIIFDDL